MDAAGKERTEQSVTETEQTTDEKPSPKRRRSPVRAIASWVAGVVTGLALLVFLAGVVILWTARGSSLEAPGWVRQEVETRIAAQLPNVDIDFASLTLAISEDWQPSIHLIDLTVTPDGLASPVTLSDVTGAFDLPALLEGELRPRVISVSGTNLDFRRDEDGSYQIALGGARTGGGRGVSELTDALSAILDLPAFSALHRIESTGMTVRYEDLRSDRAWTVDGGRIELTRDGDALRLRGDFAVLGGRAYATTGEISIEGHMHSRATTLALSVQDAAARDIATQSAGLAWLGVLDAPISGALRVTTDDQGVIGPLNATLQIGEGALAPGGTREPVPFQSARTYFRYDPATSTLQFDELSVDSAWVEATADGRIELTDIVDGVPGAMTGQLRITALTANPAGLYLVPLFLEGAEAEMRLKLDPFRLEVGRFDLRDRGQTLSINGWFEAEPEGWDVSMTARTAELSADDILELWPASAIDKTRLWVARNVLDGTVRNLQFGVRSLPTSPPDVILGFDFENLITTFLPLMPPVEAASGHAELRDNRFVITADDGWLYAPNGEGLRIAGTSFAVSDVREKPSQAEILIRAKGALSDVLTIIDQEPLQFLTKAGRSPDLATGEAELAADLRLPLIKNLPLEEMQVSYHATVTDLESAAIVPGQRLTADQVDITGTADTLTAKGEARLGAVPVGGSWSADLTPQGGGRSTFAGWATVSQTLNDQLNLGLPPGTFDGEGRADLQIDFARGTKPEFTATSDLAGLGISIAGLNWTHRRNQTGRFEVSGQLGTPAEIDSITLNAPGLSATGGITLRAGGQGLASANFSRVKIGSWLDAPVTLTGRGKDVPPAINVTGGTLDLRRLDLGQPSGKGGPVSLKLDTLRVSDTITLRNLRGDFTTRGGLSGDFTAAVEGGTPVKGTVTPAAKGSALHVTSDNAGATLAAAGLLKQGRGGSFDLALNPVGPKGTYDGKLNVQGMWLQDAPAMASLLSAVSVVGLLEQMSGNGILFNAVEADFRLSPSRVVVRSASAVGASMGVSMDGIYDMENSAMDIQGVVSPLYVINGLGRLFSRNNGEGLIGFNYRLLGPLDNPRVQVNPLSLFTPGMFREIFRRPPPTTN